MTIFGISDAHDFYMMNSDLTADRIIADYESVIESGLPLDELRDRMTYDSSFDDLTESDKSRVAMTISEIWEMNKSHY